MKEGQRSRLQSRVDWMLRDRDAVTKTHRTERKTLNEEKVRLYTSLTLHQIKLLSSEVS